MRSFNSLPLWSDCVSDIGAANTTASGDMVLNSQRQSGHPLDRLLSAQWRWAFTFPPRGIWHHRQSMLVQLSARMVNHTTLWAGRLSIVIWKAVWGSEYHCKNGCLGLAPDCPLDASAGKQMITKGEVTSHRRLCSRITLSIPWRVSRVRALVPRELSVLHRCLISSVNTCILVL